MAKCWALIVVSLLRAGLTPWGVAAAPAVMLVGLAGACSCSKPSAPGGAASSVAGGVAPPVTEIEIVPWKVVVGPHTGSETSFELEARLWTGDPTDRRSITEAQGYTLTWEIDPVATSWLTIVKPTTGFRATIKVLAGAPASGSAFVKVSAGGKTTTPGAEILLAATAVPGNDLVKALYTAGKPPATVFVNGVRNIVNAPCDVTFDAFVTRSILGQVVAPCAPPWWEVAVLSVDHQTVFAPGGATPGDNTTEVGPRQGSPRTIPIALRVMVGTSPLDDPDPGLQDDVLGIADKDLQVANSILSESRSGILLDFVKKDKVAVSDVVEILDCINGDSKTALKDEAGLLNVYYVNSLAEYRGRTCDRHEGRRQDVIYVGWSPHSPTTLIHEVGHALGLTLPGQGHTDTIRGFDRSNVMMSGDYDLDPGGRRRLTAGQAFRMNADPGSWLNWAYNPPDGDPAHRLREIGAPRLACQCGEQDPAGLCPRLGDDVARPSGRGDGIHTWDCFDQLKLDVPSLESPVAVVAGRRWRTPPGTCRDDLPGKTEVHWSATFVRFANLTRPGTCESWAAIFFRHLGVVFVPLEESKLPLSQSADLLVVTEPDPIPGPVEVTVHVYYPPAMKTIVAQDVNHALNTFGSFNRSGIKLVFFRRPGVSCPQNSPLHPEINLCYSMAGNNEASLVGPRRILVRGGRTGSTVSHYIGRAFGLLPMLIVSSGPGFPGNIMHGSPALRGKRLTLSQVFQINAFVNPSLCAPKTCPTLSQNVAP